ncbi:MAG: hypothetical protein MJZ37_10825 [Bacilli bacterium]|nr:hypothetical protein [Bacilli bacterium]
MVREYTAEEKEKLESNPYTLKVSKNKFYVTVKFKEDFWIRYQAGVSPRKIIKDFGYDLSLFTQKQIDGIVQKIRKQALSGNGFTEGENRDRRPGIKAPEQTDSPQTMFQMQAELMYLRQEVEFLKKIIAADNSKKKR